MLWFDPHGNLNFFNVKGIVMCRIALNTVNHPIICDNFILWSTGEKTGFRRLISRIKIQRIWKLKDQGNLMTCTQQEKFTSTMYFAINFSHMNKSWLRVLQKKLSLGSLFHFPASFKYNDVHCCSGLCSRLLLLEL